MKRIAAILILCTFILTLTACAGSEDPSKPKVSDSTDKPSSIGTASTVIDNTQATPSKAAGTSASQPTPNPTKRPATGSGKSSGVVAKSNNVISGQDNGTVMTELDKELDSLFSSINKLEDVDDTDLDLN